LRTSTFSHYVTPGVSSGESLANTPPWIFSPYPIPPFLSLPLLPIMSPRRVRFSNGATNLLSVRLYTAQYAILPVCINCDTLLSEVGRKKRGGYIFETYSGDHRPYHVHIYHGTEYIGRFDIENQIAM